MPRSEVEGERSDLLDEFAVRLEEGHGTTVWGKIFSGVLEVATDARCEAVFLSLILNSPPIRSRTFDRIVESVWAEPSLRLGRTLEHRLDEFDALQRTDIISQIETSVGRRIQIRSKLGKRRWALGRTLSILLTHREGAVHGGAVDVTAHTLTDLFGEPRKILTTLVVRDRVWRYHHIHRGDSVVRRYHRVGRRRVGGGSVVASEDGKYENRHEDGEDAHDLGHVLSPIPQ